MIQYDAEIQKQFNKVISYSQNIDEPQTNALFKRWANSKSIFWKAMGEQLIFEYPQPVTLEMDAVTKESRIQHFIDWVDQYSDSLSYFISQQRDGFFDNKTVMSIYLEGQDVQIPQGMKISKAIGRYWADKLSPERIDLIQCEMSRIIQENKVSGRLCLSIHPLDFLSASENQHNWRSCHALDGEYRAGNLSYMVDDVTVMAYIKSDVDTQLPRFPAIVPWNNKKWRCLFFFDRLRGLVYAGRQYPFFSRPALDLVRQCLFESVNYFVANGREAISVGLQWKHNCGQECEVNGETISFNRPYIFEGCQCVPLDQWVQDTSASMHFNDLLKSSYYSPWTLRYDAKEFRTSKLNQFPPMMVGEAIPCLKCGKDTVTHFVCNSDVMVCRECALEDDDLEREWLLTCDNCGGHIIEGEEIYEGGMTLCESCVENNTVRCEDCGASILTLVDSTYWDEKYGVLCSHCRRERIDKKRRWWASYE